MTDIFKDDNWAEVEIFRIVKDELPNEKNSKGFNIKKETAKALRILAKELMNKDESKLPNRFNVASIMYYASKLLDKKTKESCHYEKNL